MSEKITIAVDACGGDNAPQVVLDGVDLALKEAPNLEVLLCGTADAVNSFCETHERCTPVVCTEVIAMGEHPAEAVKNKKDSSIVVGCKLVREGKARGFFSAGSTGACLVAATLLIGRIKGVKRPALATMIPSSSKPTLLLDVGANADCKPEYVAQFALLGEAYMKTVMQLDAPKIGLLNIGEEPAKGSTFAQECFGLLTNQVPGFAGNCEPGALLSGKFDIVVTDGFTGNIFLKTVESSASYLFKLVKDALMSSAKAKVGALLVKSSLASLKAMLSPDVYGGSPLLGVDGVCLVGHGSSNAKAIKSGVLATYKEAECEVESAIRKAVSS